jgi:hypothetical protein
LFGSPDEALPEDQIETGWQAFMLSIRAGLIIHRTPTSLSSFSWHTPARLSDLGLTILLKKDSCYPMPEA